MPKKPIQKSTIFSLDEATEVMRALKETVLEIETSKDLADESILVIQTAFNERVKPLQEKQLELETNLRLYAEENKVQLFDDQKRKTVKTPFGTFGFRQMKAKLVCKMKKWEDAINLMRGKKKFSDYLRTKEEIDKNAITAALASKKLTKEVLETVGIALKEGDDEFVYEIDRQEAGERATA